MPPRKTILSISPIRQIMRESGGEIVSHDALIFLAKHLEEYGKELTAGAYKLTKHSKRKKITKEDIEQYLKMKKNEKNSVV